MNSLCIAVFFCGKSKEMETKGDDLNREIFFICNAKIQIKDIFHKRKNF